MNIVRNIYEELERYFANPVCVNVNGIQFNRTIVEDTIKLITHRFSLEFEVHNIKTEMKILRSENEYICLVIDAKNKRDESISILIVFKLLCHELRLFLSHRKISPNEDYLEKIMELENPIRANSTYFGNNNPYSIDALSEHGLVFGECFTDFSVGKDPQSLDSLFQECFNIFFMLLRR